MEVIEHVEEKKNILSEKNVLVILNVFTDGAGDYAFGQKIIKLLLKSGFSKDKIQLRIVYPPELNLSNFKLAYDRFIRIYNERCDKEYQVIYNKKKKYVNIDNNINNAIVALTNIFCSKYNFGLDQKIECKVNSEFQQNESVSELQEKIQYYIYDNKKKLIELIQTEYKSEPVIGTLITPNSSSTVENFKCVINSKLFEDELSKFIRDIFNNKIWSVLINNIITFFREMHDIDNENIKVLTIADINNITPIYVGFTSKPDDNLIISFLNPFISKIISGKTFFETYPHIKLCEGGFWSIIKNNSYITPGFDETFQLSKGEKNSYRNSNKPYGINIVEKIDGNIINTGGINIEEDYHICYFGQIDLKTSLNNILFLVKLNFFIEIINEKYDKVDNVIYINKTAYDYLLIAVDNEVEMTFFNNIIKEENVLIINGVKILFFNRVSSSDFIKLLDKSKEECILTGDQSYFEGISLGKNVIYDILPHKIELHKQMFHMYIYFIKHKLSKEARDDYETNVCNIEELESSFSHQQELNKSQYENIKLLELGGFHKLEFNPDTSIITFISNMDMSIQYNINFLYDINYIEDILYLFYKLSSYILENHKKDFLTWLREEMDFEHNLQTFIKIYLTNFRKSAKSKYLKYKIKYYSGLNF